MRSPGGSPSRTLFPKGWPTIRPPVASSWEVSPSRRFCGSNRTACTVELVESGGDGLWSVLGMKVDARRGALWVCSSAGSRFAGQRGWAGLFKYDPETGRLLAQYVLDSRGGPHFFNDLAVSPDGTVYVTDTERGEVYRLRPNGRHLETFLVPRQFREPNGIAVSSDGRRLFVADESAGIAVVDLRTRVCRPLGRASSMNLAGIDGLYVTAGALVAVQNAAGTERILRLDSLERPRAGDAADRPGIAQSAVRRSDDRRDGGRLVLLHRQQPRRSAGRRRSPRPGRRPRRVGRTCGRP